MTWIRTIGSLFRREPRQSSTAFVDRVDTYRMNDAYYDNYVYDTLLNGGFRETINEQLGNPRTTILSGMFNPVSEIVDVYQNVFAGGFGDEIIAEPGDQATAIDEPLKQIWRWSNMDQEKLLICKYAALHGTVGIRIVAESPDDPARRRIYIKAEHPRIIRDVQLDRRGNVEAILLEYDDAEGLDENKVVTTYRELLTKEEFTVWIVEHNVPRLKDGYPIPNELGVVPYVLLNHMPSGSDWGLNAFYRSRPLIDRINYLQAHINLQIHRHVRAKLAIAASSAPPTEIPMDDTSIAFFNTTSGGSPPVFQWLIAPLNLADAITQEGVLKVQVADKQPELKALAGEFVPDQSGETVIQLRKPAESLIKATRAIYEDALVRVDMLALSMGIVHGFWDLGTGSGTRESADRAYREGFEDHRFNTRELLPMAESERLAMQEIKQRIGYSRQRLLREQGMSDDDIDQNEDELKEQQTAATAAFSTAFDRGNVE